MKKLVLASAVVAAMFSVSAHASDEKMMFPIAGGLSDSEAQAKLDPSIKFYFGDQPTPKVISKLGYDKTSQKTNAFAKSSDKVCNHAFLSGLLALQKRAHEHERPPLLPPPGFEDSAPASKADAQAKPEVKP